MKKQTTIACIAVIALCFCLASAGQKDAREREKKEDAARKEATRQIEIAGDLKQIRPAIIKAELSDSWKLETEQESRLAFTRPVSVGHTTYAITGLRLWHQDTFTFAAEGDKVTILE